MKISMQALSVEVFATTLGNLSSILEKGLAHATQRKFDPAVLLAARLAPDMLPLTRQVQIACDLAKNSVARLAAQEPPRFEDNETSFEQLRLRIARVIDYLKRDRKSTRLNSSHEWISYAVFCLKKKKANRHLAGPRSAKHARRQPGEGGAPPNQRR